MEVTDAEFQAAKATENHVVVTESGLGGIECALVFAPRVNWPVEFKFFPMMKV